MQSQRFCASQHKIRHGRQECFLPWCRLIVTLPHSSGDPSQAKISIPPKDTFAVCWSLRFFPSSAVSKQTNLSPSGNSQVEAGTRMGSLNYAPSSFCRASSQLLLSYCIRDDTWTQHSITEVSIQTIQLTAVSISLFQFKYKISGTIFKNSAQTPLRIAIFQFFLMMADFDPLHNNPFHIISSGSAPPYQEFVNTCLQ